MGHSFYGKVMKIAVLVSGGVDSSVALRLLQEQGHELTAFYIKIWLEDEISFLGECPWQDDLSYVEEVCKQANVPLKVVSLQKEYWQKVVAYTLSEIKAGRTPNPDVLCNQQIKFGLFLDHIDASYDKIATGHYAQVVQNSQGRYELHKSPDPIKDQTYFLSYLSQEQLARALFPIGHLHKEQVREHARAFNLPNKDRKDSQGICFLGKLKFNDFIKHYLGEQKGHIVEFETGKVLGEHKGFWYHTIGQRQGLGLAGGPWYVVEKDSAKNIVFVSNNYYSEDKLRDRFVVTDCNWFSGRPPENGPLSVKMRHGATIYDCSVTVLDNARMSVQLQERDQGIASGQFAVFYQGDHCLGAGKMSTREIQF